MSIRPWDDYAPAVTANGTLFFTSRRPESTNRQDYMDDVYRVNNIRWRTGKNLHGSPENINTPESQGAISISPDGRTLYLALCAGNRMASENVTFTSPSGMTRGHPESDQSA
jgi:hypothetical protein